MIGRCFSPFVVLCILLLAAALAATGLRPAQNEVASTPSIPTADPIRVIVSIPPLKGLVTPLLEGIDSQVETLIPVGVSEHGYEIPASKLAALAKADIVVYVGRGLEPQVSKFLTDHPKAGREIVKFAEVIESATKEEHEADAQTPSPSEPKSPPSPSGNESKQKPDTKKAERKPEHDDADHHEHDDHEGHNHENDPHLWLDPHHVKKLIPAVREAVERTLTARSELTDTLKSQLKKAEAATVQRVDAVDTSYTRTLAKATNRTIVVAHDAYTMLAERYNLTSVAIAGLNASEPTITDIRHAITALKEKGATVVFVEPQLSRTAGDKVAKATGAKVLVLDPIGGDDWFVTMTKNLDALAQGLGVARE